MLLLRDILFSKHDSRRPNILVRSITYEDTDRAKDNRHRQTLIVTHNYLHPSGKLTSTGHRIWDGLVRTQENTSFVFCGDQLGDGARLISLGDSGNKIYQMFANYQGENAKNGTMRIVTFYLEEGRVEVASYSPVTGELTNDNNKFEFRDVRFRTDVQANAGPDRTYRRAIPSYSTAPGAGSGRRRARKGICGISGTGQRAAARWPSTPMEPPGSTRRV